MPTSKESPLSTARSGKDISREYVTKVQTFLDSGVSLPVGTDGAVNVSALAEAVGVPRQSLYKNPSIRALLEQYRTIGTPASYGQNVALAEPNIPASENVSEGASESTSDKKTKTLERRINQHEQQNASLVAENAELRRQMKILRLQMGRDDMAIETGRRIPRPPDADA